jgi:hypothetical protein
LSRADIGHEYFVDEVHDEVVGDRIPGHQQPMPEHALAELTCDFDRHVGADVAAFDASRE